MLTWIAVLSLAGVAVLAARWVLRRVDSLGRPRRFPVTSILALLVLAAGCLVPVVRHQRNEAALSDVASDLAGRQVDVRCQTAGQEWVDAGSELGYVPYDAAGRPARWTLIKRAQCAALSAYRGSDHQRPSLDEVVAVHVLTHEAMHLAGHTVEADAECRAMQRDARTARLLGASPEAAAALARRYWKEVYPRMEQDYRAAECTSGGALDELGSDPPWSS